MKRLYMLLLAALVLMSLCACQTTEEVPADTLCSVGWCRAPGAMATHTVAAALIVQLIIDSQLYLPSDLLLMFSLY